MPKLTVCIGSSCYLKGADKVIEEIRKLIDEHELKGKLEFCGSFCMGECGNDGVNVTLDGVHYSIKPDDVREFFEKEVLEKYEEGNLK